ncbi:MAG: peptide chain release factor N(5)-glutamine methyltransferase [Kiritimatiellia bacterium]
MPIPSVNVAVFLKEATNALHKLHPEECRLLAELLVSRALHCPRLELPLHYSNAIPPEIMPSLRADLERLTLGTPWQYLVGETEFFGRKFKCDQRALIPRPETELLVEWFLRYSPIHTAKAPVIVEAGVGSGCIIITIAAELPHATCIGTDISNDALNLALENAERHGIAGRIELRPNDLLADLPPCHFDAVISNPPYVTTAEYQELPPHIRNFEPALALLAGDDGMKVAAWLAPQANRCLKPGGALFMEFAPARIGLLRKYLADAGFVDITTANDYVGRPHFICARLPE